MSLHDYPRSLALNSLDEPFYSLIMAAMRQADTDNLALLKVAWPSVHHELMLRREVPLGVLRDDEITVEKYRRQLRAARLAEEAGIELEKEET